MSHFVPRVPIEVKNFLSQKISTFFSKPIFSVFQDSRIIFSEKHFSGFLVHYLESELITLL